MPEVQFITVSKAESGQKLLQFLERRLTGDVPRSAIQRWIRKGQVRVNKGRKKPFDRIESGQIVRIPPYTPGAESAVAAKGGLDIIHEDAHIMAIAKPAGLAVHGGDKVKDSVTGRLTAMFADADFMPTLAHRLDKGTSGLLLAAKEYCTLRRLNDSFAAGDVAKLYLTWVEGQWPHSGEMILEDKVEKQGSPGKEKVRVGSGKAALARVVALTQTQRHTLLAVRLLTGRTHQIRVQLASRNHPVVGDHKYGEKNQHRTMRLHCYSMRIDGHDFSLAPPWTGPWSIPDTMLQSALALLA
ncbi:RluA family pseudouridine synthase [Pseudodesulfovibrio piezophilus]|uniref:Pseudouridine synthase n=1 Tax=Pseudodesulfovibrio piezophilus (strain DSM 21447 / JCM 15486 / C1TLV30) TaxID=1322246 RepID=M1WXT1_PSEP2|nr:RluA family pseudouridine synthase [Pseudodesulfovibrio piezophilus]CCH49893.1 Pseudouridine synthase [Pseudodesulfovibrio piezophilus C1TLV30]